MNGQYLMLAFESVYEKKQSRGFLPRTRRKAGGIRRLTLKYFKIFAREVYPMAKKYGLYHRKQSGEKLYRNSGEVYLEGTAARRLYGYMLMDTGKEP